MVEITVDTSSVSASVRAMILVGVIIPTRIEKFLVMLHGKDGSFKHMDDNFPLIEYANDNNMIIVSPDMNNGYYINKPDYRVNDFIMSELIPLIFRTYGLKEELPMYIVGVSMGGYGSLLLGATFPSRFRKIISISGAFIAHDVAIGNPQVVGLPADKATLKYFTDTFAPFDTLEEDIYRNPLAAIVKGDVDTMPPILMTCGTKDDWYERNVDAIELFHQAGIVCDWLPLENGIHDYKCFDEGFRYAFKKLEA